MRVGFGTDVHRFGGTGPLAIAGVVVDHDRGLEATSDGDVAIHALVDALLGAAGLGDLGSHFPSTDERWHGASSVDLLARTVELVAGAGYHVVNVDLTIVAQTVLVAPHRAAMRSAVADALGIGHDRVSIKATSTDHIGFVGRDEGIAAMAAVLVDSGPAQARA